MLKFIMGLIIGFILSFFSMVVIESGYFSSPVLITGQTLINRMTCSEGDSHPDWWLNGKDAANYIVELRYPLSRQYFLVPASDMQMKKLPPFPSRIHKEDIEITTHQP